MLPFAVRHAKTPELNLNFIRGNENVTHSAQSELSGRSQTTDFDFANYRFSFRKLQISISFRKLQ